MNNNIDDKDHDKILVLGLAIGIKQGKRWLVRDVDISISKGEIVTLIGPNGSGKSTVAKMVTGVLTPSTGTIERRANLKIGYVPQKLNIDWTFPLSVSRLLTLTHPHSAHEVSAALETLKISHLFNDPVQQLSGGEFQRVLLARAMISKPDLLVLDEPVQGVDYAGQTALYELIGQIREQTGCGVLLISHDLHVVMAQTDRVICLNGHICCSGSPEHVASSPQYQQLFGPTASKTHAFYHHHHDHIHTHDGRIENQAKKQTKKQTGKNHAG